MNEETKAKNIKYMNTWIKENYMRVGGSYPKAFAQEFKDACKQSGVSQSEVFRNVMQETINKIKNRRICGFCMPIERIELSADPYHGSVLPLY